MKLGTDADLVQDATSDCSVVASLCALITLGEEGLRKVMCMVIVVDPDLSLYRSYLRSSIRTTKRDNVQPYPKTGNIYFVYISMAVSARW